MLRGVLGCLLMRPARSSVSTIFLDVGFGRGSAVQPRIEVDIGQILPLLGHEGFVEGLTPAIRFSC
jgi:hypothetical protein